MTSNGESLTPTEQLLGEALERLTASGVVTVHVPRALAAQELHKELRTITPFDRDGEAAAILALRAADWPRARATTPDERFALAQVAWEVQHLLASDDARHVADFLRHAELGAEHESLRSIESVLPTATRAITEYRRLMSITESPNVR